MQDFILIMASEYSSIFGCRTDASRSQATLQRFGDLTISIALTRPFLAISKTMRLVLEIVIIGVVISLGWAKPFKEHYAYVNRTITSELHDIGKKPKKKQDTSVKPH